MPFYSEEITYKTVHKFGIREIKADLDAKNHRLIEVNGKRIMIMGGGYSPDLLQRRTRERYEIEFAYTKDLGLNTFRLEGKMENDLFFEMADEWGFLVMTGWMCCDAWQMWWNWDEKV